MARNLMAQNKQRLCFISVHYTTIHHTLIRCGMSHKRSGSFAEERNGPFQTDFIRRMSQYDPGFLDETNKN